MVVVAIWFEGWVGSAISFIRIGHQDTTPGCKAERGKHQKGGEAIAWQGRGSDNPSRGEGLQPWAEGQRGRDECGRKCKERGSSNIMETLKLTVCDLIRNACE